MPSSQNDTCGGSNAIQGESRVEVNLAPPTSSRYSDSSRSPSTPTSHWCRSIAGGVEWRGADFIESHGRCVDTPDFDDGSNMQAVETFVNGNSNLLGRSDANMLMALSIGSNPTLPAPTQTETLYLSPQTQVSPIQEEEQAKKDGLWQASSGPKQGGNGSERTEDSFHKIKNVGHRKKPHRVEKAKHELRAPASPPEYIDRREPERAEMHDAHNRGGPQNTLQSHGAAEHSGSWSADGRRPVSTRSPEGTPLGTTMPPEHDDFNPPKRARQASGDVTEHVEGPSSDLELYWPNNDQEDDVWTGTRKAEEQMRGADDAVGEVYDDSLIQTRGSSEEESDLGVADDNTNGTPTDTANDVTRQEPTQIVEVPPVSVEQVEKSDAATSRQDKRRAIYQNSELPGHLANSSLSNIGTFQPTSEMNRPGCDVNKTDEDSTASEPNASPTRPKSLFPGESLIPYGAKQAMKGSLPSKKRHLPDEAGVHDYRLNPPKERGRAQRSNFEPFKEIVDSIGRIWSTLDHSHIYVTSNVDIEELAGQQHPTKRRLWSWSEPERELFDRHISDLRIRRRFGLEVVCLGQTRQYRSLDHLEYWKAYFEGTEPRCWLAVLTRYQGIATAREKVRKTTDEKKG